MVFKRTTAERVVTFAEIGAVTHLPTADVSNCASLNCACTELVPTDRISNNEDVIFEIVAR